MAAVDHANVNSFDPIKVGVESWSQQAFGARQTLKTVSLVLERYTM